jgi:hypothetical protein
MQASLDNRAAPYTVPMKAVPQECGALGRIRPALRFVRSVRGRECHNFSCNFSHKFSCNFSPSVLVRALPLCCAADATVASAIAVGPVRGSPAMRPSAVPHAATNTATAAAWRTQHARCAGVATIKATPGINRLSSIK